MGLLCCSDTVREPIRKKSSHATRQGMLVHSRLSSMSHCGMILGVKSGFCARELIYIPKTKQRSRRRGRRRRRRRRRPPKNNNNNNNKTTTNKHPQQINKRNSACGEWFVEPSSHVRKKPPPNKIIRPHELIHRKLYLHQSLSLSLSPTPPLCPCIYIYHHHLSLNREGR